jgi:hypothetical protein
MPAALSPDLQMDAYWRAANYLAVGQVYLQDNPASPEYCGHDATTSNPDARLAIRFCYSVRKQVAALDGVDLIVVLDEVRNRAVANPISDPASRCAALVLASQEDEQIARHAGTLVANRLTRIDAAEG